MNVVRRYPLTATYLVCVVALAVLIVVLERVA